jgi:putative transposase
MPSRNMLKIYIKDGYYHVYNRGVEKRTIFEDEQDYKVFLDYLKEYLSPPPDPKMFIKTITLQEYSFKGLPRLPKNYFDKIELLAFCLMPNHFHLLLKQTDKNVMEKFMRSLSIRYSTYFNKKYDRVGGLFQDTYKAILIIDESYLLHLSRYIHLNPTEYTSDLIEAYTSYADYLGLRKTQWLKPQFILSFFDQAKETLFQKTSFYKYKDFVENYNKESSEILGKITLE